MITYLTVVLVSVTISGMLLYAATKMAIKAKAVPFKSFTDTKEDNMKH